MRSRLSLWIGRLAAAAVIAGALAYIPYRVYGSNGYVRYRRMQRDYAELKKGNEALEADNRDLSREIHRLRDDLSAVMAVARDELGMVLPGEIVLQIDRGGGSMSAPPAPPPPPSPAVAPAGGTP